MAAGTYCSARQDGGGMMRPDIYQRRFKIVQGGAHVASA
jgi:hypothetical protein